MKKELKIAILSSEKSWFKPYALKLRDMLVSKGLESNYYTNHKDFDQHYDIVFILSYFRIIEPEFLAKNKYNLVVHESDLPKGRGWAPLFWQVLEGKNVIPIVLFEASEKVDEGDIYLKDYIELTGNELNEEIRKKQAEKTIELCLTFINNYPDIKASKQKGEATYYPKRTKKDSQLDINKSLEDQFQLLRIVNNRDFPAYFIRNNEKYIIKIEKEE